MFKIPSEQFWKLYENLPQELKDAIFDEETGNNIYETCKRNGVTEKQGDIADCVGQVLVGVLAPEDFQEVLEKELKLEKEAAKKTAQEINRFIFYPVKPALEQLFKTEIASSEKPAEKLEIKKEKPTEPAGEDVYREPIE